MEQRLQFLQLLFLICRLVSGSSVRVGVLYEQESGVRKDGVARAIEQHSDLVQAHYVSLNTSDTVTTVCDKLFDSFSPNLLIDVSDSEIGANAARAIGLPVVSANLVHSQPAAIGKHAVVFKSPDRLVIEAARDAITHFGLSTRKVRVLYDHDYAALIPVAREMIRVSDIEFELIHGLEGELLYKKIRRMRNPKVSGFLVLANTETIAKLTNAINGNEMFRKAYTWLFVTKDKRKVKCSTCKHANLIVVQPVHCHLHEYTGFPHSPIALKDKVDFFFAYDLTRMTLQAIANTNSSADDGNRFALTSFRPKCSALTDSVTSRSDYPLEHVLFRTSRDFHGKYGEFVVASSDDAQDVSQVTRSNYQDMVMEINRVEYLRDGRTIQKEGSWFYGEPTGSIISRGYDEGEGDSSGGGGEASGPSGCSGVTAPAVKFDGYTFVVYHHPPFITIHSDKITVNASLEQLAVPRGDMSEVWKRADGVETVYFSGFLVDLLKEIARRYKTMMKKEFPKYRIVVSKLFTSSATDSGDGAQKGGGFGTKELPKAAAKEGEEQDPNVKDFRGLVQEVRCEPKKAALMPMTPTPERKTIVAFSEPFFDTVSLSILMKKPILQYHYWKFVSVLEYSVWICITGAYLFTSVLLWIFDRSSPYSYRNDPDRYKNDVEKRVFTLKESLWFCITSLTPQGGGEAPKALSGRLVAATWWLFGFIVIASYTANLAAFLTVSRLDHPINNFDELTRQYKVKYAPFEGSSTKTYFERMARIEEKFYQVWKDLSLNDDLEEDERSQLAVWDYPISDKFTKIWAAMTEAQAYVGYNEAINAVKKSDNASREGNALVAETPVIDYAVQIHCDVMKVGGEFNPRPNSLMFNVQDRDLVREIDDVIIDMKRDGSMQALKEVWWFQKVKKRQCYEHRKLYNGLTLENAGGIFLIVAAGVIATVVALWIENWYYGMQTQWDMKKAKTPPVHGASDTMKKKQDKRRCCIIC